MVWPHPSASFSDIHHCYFSGFLSSLTRSFPTTTSQRCSLAFSPAEWHFPASSPFSAPKPVRCHHFQSSHASAWPPSNAMQRSAVYSLLHIIREHTGALGHLGEFLSWLFTSKISLSTEGWAPPGLNCFKTDKELRLNAFWVHFWRYIPWISLIWTGGCNHIQFKHADGVSVFSMDRQTGQRDR